ncbi:MAG: peptidoglycan recognition protein [Chloroflexi bacterium]|nr:peptidoglycan recognition protein [Chloroflexota bacterium]OJV95118.1 MAG: hypothetical protein BGO39_24180 [Chloroflexi bacterium 54-19]
MRKINSEPEQSPLLSNQLTNQTSNQLKNITSNQETGSGYGAPLSAYLHSRRRFLKVAGGAVALAGSIAALPLGAGPLLADAADFVVTSGFPAQGTYLSPVKAVGQTYNAAGSYWEVTKGDATKLTFEIRGSKDGASFSEWFDVSIDNFEGPDHASTTRTFGPLLNLNTPYIQFRLTIPSGVAVKLAGITFIDTAAGPDLSAVPVSNAPIVASTKPNIISRAGWGANESWRYSGKSVIWPTEYRTIKAVIIHHSETSNVYNADPSVDVRSIYRYHAITQGWGDIGYNYLIDWKGNIYEGRYGGDDVVGGHAYQYNYGSIGICLIGSFKTVKPTDAQLNSLTRLLSWKAYSKNLNPTGKAYLIDKTVNVILGHRDVIATTCPGDTGYSLLPGLRSQVASILGGTVTAPTTPTTPPPPTTPTGTYNVDLKSITFSPTTLKLGDTLKIQAVVTNTGSATIETQDPPPGFVYEEGQTYESLAYDKQTNKFRVAVDFAGNSGVSHPYRWGLGKSLAPGASATITGYVKMKTVRQVDMFGGVIQEYVKYFEDNVGTTRISTMAAGINRTAKAPSRAADPNIRYFPETGHNLGYAFRTYWENNGGLPMFGYPLTEEFTEASDTEPGKSFLVQYFQRNRFEYHPEFKGTKNEVLLGLLGVKQTAGRTFAKATAIKDSSTKVYFAPTSHTLGGVFYNYWKANGGLPIFGYPISEEFQEKNPDDGKTYTVQYFERNRFEYHPEFKGTKDEVLLGLLGTALCRQKGWIT